MIDKKKIREAANAVVEKEYARDIPIIKATFKNGFKAGINWFLDNLWHPASEEPIRTRKESEYVECLVQFKDGMVNLYNYDTWDHWWVCDTDNEVFLEKISRWLYIDDLLKGGK